MEFGIVELIATGLRLAPRVGTDVGSMSPKSLDTAA